MLLEWLTYRYDQTNSNNDPARYIAFCWCNPATHALHECSEYWEGEKHSRDLLQSTFGVICLEPGKICEEKKECTAQQKLYLRCVRHCQFEADLIPQKQKRDRDARQAYVNIGCAGEGGYCSQFSINDRICCRVENQCHKGK